MRDRHNDIERQLVAGLSDAGGCPGTSGCFSFNDEPRHGISLRLADDACGDPLHLGRAAYVRGDTARGAFPQLGWRSIQTLIATIDRFRNDTMRDRSLLPMVAPQPASRL